MKRIILTFSMISVFSIANATIAFYGVRRVIWENENSSCYTCAHAPIVCTTIEEPMGPNLPYKVIVYNSDGTSEDINAKDVIITETATETQFKLIFSDK